MFDKMWARDIFFSNYKHFCNPYQPENKKKQEESSNTLIRFRYKMLYIQTWHFIHT